MSVVVSDTSPLHHLILCGAEGSPPVFDEAALPLHYLILCGAEGVLPRLFRQVLVPPTVFRELQQPNTPPLVRQWAASLPAWIVVQTPKSMNLPLDVDAGELEAICLAREIHADAVLMDDRAGRNAAIRCGLAVVGTIEVLEQAAARRFIDLPQTMQKLRQTNARLDVELIRAALERDKARKHGP